MAMPSFDASPDSAALRPPLDSSQNKGEGLGVRGEADSALEWGEPCAPPPPKGEAGRGLDFADRWRELEWDDVGMQIRAKTARDVERALANPRRTLQDFMGNCSPRWH